MAETQRTLTALLGGLPDNTAGEISPEDVRDAVVSLAGGFGGLSSTTLVTGAIDIGTETLIDFWDTVLPNDVDSVVSGSLANERITFTLAGTYQVHVDLTGVVTLGSAGRIMELYVALNGVTGGPNAVSGMRSGQLLTGTATDPLQWSMSSIVTFAASDYIELRANCSSAGGPVTLSPVGYGANFWAKRLN